MRRLAIDTWAFVEVALDRPLREEVEERLRHADDAFTVREVVVETYGFLAHRAGARAAGAWWRALREDGIAILEPGIDELAEYEGRAPRDGRLSLVDLSLAYAARKRGAKEVATGDAEFRRLGLVPIFAK